jgi:hypothetical protein
MAHQNSSRRSIRNLKLRGALQVAVVAAEHGGNAAVRCSAQLAAVELRDHKLWGNDVGRSDVDVCNVGALERRRRNAAETGNAQQEPDKITILTAMPH